MITYIIIILLIAVLAEFLLLRKGLKAGKKNGAHLRHGSSGSLSSSVQNKRVKSSDPPFQRKTSDMQDVPPTSIETPHNVITFTEISKKTEEETDITHELRQKEQAGKVQPREKSMLDIIQEIRGKAASQTAEESEAEPTETVESEIQPGTDAIPLKETNGKSIKTAQKIHNNEDVAEEEILEVNEADIEEVEIDAETPDMTDIEETEEMIAPDDLIKSGIQLVRQGDLEAGIAKLEHVTQTAPEKADAYFNLGIAYTLKEDLPRAIKVYQKAIKLEPSYGKAYFTLGTLYLKQKNVREAIEKLEKAVQLLPEPMKALWNLYEAYRSSELFTKALATLEKLLVHEPEDASLHNHLGICYVKLGDYSKAIKSWKKSVSLGASSQLIYYNLGKTYELCGEFSSAIEQYTQFLDLTTNTSEWQDLLSEVRDRLDNLQLRQS